VFHAPAQRLLPGLPLKDTGGVFVQDTFWNQLALFSKVDGANRRRQGTVNGFYLWQTCRRSRRTRWCGGDARRSWTASPPPKLRRVYDYTRPDWASRTVWGIDSAARCAARCTADLSFNNTARPAVRHSRTAGVSREGAGCRSNAVASMKQVEPLIQPPQGAEEG